MERSRANGNGCPFERQKEYQLLVAVTSAGIYEHNVVRMRTGCGCLTRGQQTELYDNIRRSAAIFRISDLKDFKISSWISGFHVRLRDFKKDFQPSVRDFKLVSNPSLQTVGSRLER